MLGNATAAMIAGESPFVNTVRGAVGAKSVVVHKFVTMEGYDTSAKSVVVFPSANMGRDAGCVKSVVAQQFVNMERDDIVA